jgi:cytochrome c oxidase subunit 2
VRYWSILFALIAVLSVAAFVYAPFDRDWWLPNYSSANPGTVDQLRDAESQLSSLANRQSSLARTAAGSESPSGLADEQAKIQAELAAVHRGLADVAERKQLLPESREVAGQVASALESAESATASLRAGQGKDAATYAETASKVLGDAEATLGGMLGRVDYHTSSSAGREVDHLFLLILWITGIIFIGTQIALVWAAWRFVPEPGRRAQYFHGSQRLEVIWTIIPAAILVFIALYQMGAWTDIKFESSAPDVQPLARISARQFQWKIRYAGPDGRIGTPDDLHAVSDLHFVKDRPVKIELVTEDVLHSFYLPQLRIKQDAVPGLTIPVWFDCDQAGTYELVCAELCGWGHTKMRGHVTVHETQRDFDEWMTNALREQNRTQLNPTVASAATTASTTTEGGN